MSTRWRHSLSPSSAPVGESAFARPLEVRAALVEAKPAAGFELDLEVVLTARFARIASAECPDGLANCQDNGQIAWRVGDYLLFRLLQPSPIDLMKTGGHDLLVHLQPGVSYFLVHLQLGVSYFLVLSAQPGIGRSRDHVLPSTAAHNHCGAVAICAPGAVASL